jgi:hypothetical protein
VFSLLINISGYKSTADALSPIYLIEDWKAYSLEQHGQVNAQFIAPPGTLFYPGVDPASLPYFWRLDWSHASKLVGPMRAVSPGMRD